MVTLQSQPSMARCRLPLALASLAPSCSPVWMPEHTRMVQTELCSGSSSWHGGQCQHWCAEAAAMPPGEAENGFGATDRQVGSFEATWQVCSWEVRQRWLDW